MSWQGIPAWLWFVIALVLVLVLLRLLGVTVDLD